MTKKVFALDTKAGIQRDGTLFDKECYTDGRWVRFQRSRPRKIGGYRQITGNLAGPSRGVYVIVKNALNNVYSGYSDGLQVVGVNNNGVGAGVTDFKFSGPITALTGTVAGSGYTPGTYARELTGSASGSAATASIVVGGGGTVTGVTLLSGGLRYLPGETLTATLPAGSGFTVRVSTITAPFTANVNNNWTFDTFTDTNGTGANLLLAHASRDLSDIADETNTPLLAGLISGSTMWAAGIFSVAATITSGSAVITLDTADPKVAAGQLVTGPGIPAATRVLSVITTTVTLTANATASYTSLPVVFDNEVTCSGGVVSLHPYVFVYGNEGFIRNCSAGNIDDWTSADANEVNVATGKIVHGYPVRGGSNSPSGLFWSLDSIIRVSFNPQSLGVAGTANFAAPTYWRYDIITNQSSFMSSAGVIEYDGIFFWCGTDRFLLYNGVTKEVPNPFNQNYFFDNLNYTQRQKVFASKVPRFGEIWWFYPRGDNTECTDAIIYNIRENVWYDAGEALGAQRSAGYFSQVFRFPVNAGTTINATGGINVTTITNAGSAYTNGTYSYLSLTGGSGSGATATIVVLGNVVISCVIEDRGTGYAVGDLLSATIPAGSGFELTVSSVMSFVSLWQHEVGTDAIQDTQVLAIESYVETSDLGWVAGGPSQPSPIGENRWLRLERVEPDFILDGDMELYIIGRPYAQEANQTTGPYTFDATTGKIDMKEQRRELRLKFVSNQAGGNYQMGKVIVSADIGDVRGYST